MEFARGCNFKCDFCSITAYHNANQNHRPVREVVAEMAATGSRRFFIVDDNIVSQPAKVRELCKELIPLRINWVGQASIHIAQDSELLDLLVKSGCRGLLIGMESLDPDNLRDMGKSWNLRAARMRRTCSRFRDHGLAVYGTFVFGYDNDDRRRSSGASSSPGNKAVPGRLQPPDAVSGHAALSPLAAEGRLLKPSWWLDPPAGSATSPSAPKSWSSGRSGGPVPGVEAALL